MFDHLSVLSKCESDQRLHGLSGVGKDYSWSDWPLGGSETGMESSASKDPPFFFGSSFATTSSSSSTPATASSLAPAQYLIRTNYVATLI